jgi:hypothetical protein
MATSCAAISSTAMAGVDPTAALSAPLTIATSTPSGTPVVTPATVPVTSQFAGGGFGAVTPKASEEEAYAQYLLRGVRGEFRISFNRQLALQSAPKNMRSAAEHPEVVSEYLAEEVAAGRVVGPLPEETVAGVISLMSFRLAILSPQVCL